ncbi:large proline-rich protein bag6 isoform X8 [Drosophila sulfurigaster albostrigata]|uniref:large proline-rich protein bag6 isoform X8 n=1 Tax=Drosophila sulfurigaster albostrigata TaxID=89887 RepID=UPI002D21DB5A|nr:large proline-rich protein bag6 isoform X8 [Drosophila sulfurigaster albostrigata]
MLINLKVKTLDARTHEFSIDNEITIRQFKDQIAEKTNIAAENQRIIYQGRVLADDKQVKEYDVDGKVLHVAERPPFSQRGANATNNDEPQRSGFRNLSGRPAPRNMRNSPYFRALDGMLVGTMAIPVNNGALNTAGTRTPPNRFPNSSSFCINRITVALHMIDCANNIAAYLENPEVGLNNQSLDILQRGRWTMESTVVEVGVSSTDNPRNNNIIDMVQDAVNAALSRNTPGRNYTVVQLPTVYTNEAGGDPQQAANDAAAGGAGSDVGEEPTAAAAVIIEDVIVSDDEAADDIMPILGDDDEEGAAAAATQATGAGASTAATGDAANAAGYDANGANGSNVAVTGIGPRRRTRPQVLANVIQRYRTVQTRLAPFVDRYYEILEQDPAFEEAEGGEEAGQGENVARDNAQRIFDRVSEAFHYLSHAQHAISDLMLDLSQPGPRVLTCRPILVEQSGYIRSNNMFAANLPDMASPHTHPHPHQHPHAATATGSVVAIPINSPPNVANATADALRNAAQDALSAAAAAGGQANAAGGFWELSPNFVEDPVDPPNQQPSPSDLDPWRRMVGLLNMAVGGHAQAAAGTDGAAGTGTGDAATTQSGAANAAAGAGGAGGGAAATLVPNIISINLPVHLMATAMHPQGRQAPAADAGGNATAATATAASATAAATGTSEATGVAASTSGGTRSGGEQRANTLPTTATQTRSTARPQIQIGGNNNWAGRIAPTHTAFDRFLPCNSHHIREPAPLPQNNNNNTSNNNSNANTNANSARSNRRAGDIDAASIALGGIADVAVTVTASVPGANASSTSSPSSSSSSSASSSSTGATTAAGADAAAASASASSSSSATQPTTGATTINASNLRAQLRRFLHHSVFEELPINEETMSTALDRALEWFNDSLLYLPQYERPEYNSRDSVCNTLRQSLRLAIELCSTNCEADAQFEQRLTQIREQFRKRLYSVLILCLGSANAELYWRQLMRLLFVPLRSNLRNEALQFLCSVIDPEIPTHTDTADAQQFLVLRNAQSTTPADAAQPFVAPPPLAFPAQQQQQSQSQTALDNDVEMADVASSSNSSSATELDKPLPDVTVGSQPWHNNFPNDWLPVITRDLQTQTEQNHPQPPYSDAYISGMSAKRRKIIQTEKPSSSVECLIASGVQRAIQSTGLSAPNGPGGGGVPVVNPDLVIGAIAHDAAVQAAYTDAVRTNARERIKQDNDYKPSKYPQIAKFTEQK